MALSRNNDNLTFYDVAIRGGANFTNCGKLLDSCGNYSDDTGKASAALGLIMLKYIYVQTAKIVQK